MKIRKYFAADMRQALNMAREQQGPEVVILANRKVMGGIELLAAEDYDESLFTDHRQKQQPEKPNQPQIQQQQEDKHSLSDAAPAPLAAPTPASFQASHDIWENESTLERMQNELKSLRDLLEQQMSGLAWGDVGRTHPLWANLLRRFGKLGLSPALARSIIEQIPQNMELEKAWRMSLAYLTYRIKTVSDNILTPGAVLAFMGGSGVGKTTTIAKLATQYVMQQGGQNIILATTDCYRVGGRDQLRNYARILGIPLRSIHSAQEMQALIDQYYGEKVILIDTAGLNPRDKNYAEQLSILTADAYRLRTCLVLSANTQTTNIHQLPDQFRSLQPYLTVVTKLDEAISMGSLLSAIVEHNLEVAYLSCGQRVPEDFHKAEAHNLVTRAIANMKRQPESANPDETIEQTYGEFVMSRPFGARYEH